METDSTVDDHHAEAQLSHSIGATATPPQIVVLGDVSMDTLLVPVPTVEKSIEDYSMRFWPNQNRWLVIDHPSGAWLLKALIDHAIGLPAPCSRTYEELKADDQKLFREGLFWRSLVKVKLFRRSPTTPSKDKVYRIDVSEGWFDRKLVATPASPIVFKDNPAEKDLFVALTEELKNRSGSLSTDVVVIHDTGNAFRQYPALTMPHIENAKAIVWQMLSPLAHGALWNAFTEHPHYSEATVLVVREECLRQLGVNVRAEGSIERTFQELRQNKKRPTNPFAHLSRCRYVIVLFDTGAICYDNSRSAVKAHLSPDWSRGNAGFMANYSSLMTAAVVKAVHRAIGQNLEFDAFIDDGVRLGVALIKKHYLNGYADHTFLKEFAATNTQPDPYKSLFKLNWLLDEEHQVLTLSPPAMTTVSRIDLICDAKFGSKVEAFATDIVFRGLAQAVKRRDGSNGGAAIAGVALDWPKESDQLVPYAQYGDISTCDQDEINEFASLKVLLKAYIEDKDRKRPLCVAVFGPPGAGKSFTVRNIVKSVDDTIAQESLEYNLAQYTDWNELVTAFHKVQDRALSNKVPLVFFDEFDAPTRDGELGWLKYMLAPMQDGTFRFGESSYRIGRAIFVFAGGTSSTYEDFELRVKNARVADKKGKDFLSRLRGRLNISDITYKGCSDRDTIMVRRAIILRALLQEKCKAIIRPETGICCIDSDVVHAMLQIDEFEHGVRSMEAIIEMATISSTRKSFHKSSLPPEQQLGLHVNAAEFLSYVDGTR